MNFLSQRWLVALCALFFVAFVFPVFADAPSDVHEEQEVNPKPELKKPVKVRFPSSIRKKISSGEIIIQFVVTTEGKVTDLSVVKFDDPDMVGPALTAYDGASYTPGMIKGAAVNTRMKVTIPLK